MPSPFMGEIFTFLNPDGSEVTLRGWGNQFEAIFETLDGYTVVKGDDGYYEYATTEESGQLVPSGTRVGEADPETLALPQHARPTRDVLRRQAEDAQSAMGAVPRWMQRREEDRARRMVSPPEGLPSENPPERPEDAADGPGGAPPSGSTTGDYLGLVLLVDFSDFPRRSAAKRSMTSATRSAIPGSGTTAPHSTTSGTSPMGSSATRITSPPMSGRHIHGRTTRTRRSRTAHAPRN